MKHIKVKNKKFEDGEWWYYGQADGRRRVDAHVKKNETRMFLNGKYIPKTHPLHKSGRYKTFEAAAFSSLSQYATTTEGYVYLISNPAWKGWIKVGMAIDAEDRCTQYQTSSPHRDYKLEYKKYFKDRKESEFEAHAILKKHTKNHVGEWFKVSLKKAKQVLENIDSLSSIQPQPIIHEEHYVQKILDF